MVGFILSWCGLLLEWVVRIYLSRSDLAKVLKLLSIVSCASVGGVFGVGENDSPLSSSL